MSQDREHLIRASYIEIYNEEVRDLLGKDHTKALELKEHPDKGVYVKDLTAVVVKDYAEIDEVMKMGGKRRTVGFTAMNADSSRSHSLFTVVIETSEEMVNPENGALSSCPVQRALLTPQASPGSLYRCGRST